MLTRAAIDLARRRRGVALAVFTAAFLVALVAEWLMLAGRALPAPITLCAGVLSGSLLVTRQSRWGLLIAIAIVLRAGFIELNDGLSPGWPVILDILGMVAVAALIGASPALLFPRSRDALAPNQVVVVVIAAGVVGLGTLALIRYSVIPVESPAIAAATVTLSLAIGYLLGGAPVAVLGRRTHLARPRTVARFLSVSLAIMAFVVTTLVALANLPTTLYERLGLFTDGWIWIAALAGIVMGLRTHTIGTNFAILFAVSLAAIAYFRHLRANPAELFEVTLEWQISGLGLVLVLLSANALIIGVRHAADQKRAQVAIIDAMLGRPDPTRDDPGGDGVSAREAFTDALAAVAAIAEADTARLYRIDAADRSVTLVHAWPEVEAGTETEHELQPLMRLFRNVMLGRRAEFTIGLDPDDGALAGLDALGLAGMRTAYLQPIVADTQVIGASVLMGRTPRPFHQEDIEPLLSLIAEFYVVDRKRERALASIGNYQQRLRELAARTALAEERVRRETAVELHDGLIQRLAVARMKLGELRHRGGDAGPVGAITDIVDESLATSRGIIHDLSPSVVYELGLVPGLEKLVDDLRTEGRFHLTLRQHGEACPVEEPVRVGIYHVVQELVENSIRHSGGDRIWIDVYWEQATLDAVVVSDNGRGDAWWLAETAADEPSGLGLLSASERLRPIGYDIKFERRLGDGTRAIVFWSSPSEG